MKILCKVLALIFVCALVFSLVACDNKTYQYSEEFVLEEFTNIVTKIENHSHVHTEDVLPGMTEEEFEAVGEAIHVAIHDGGDYMISNNGKEYFIDDDGNHIYMIDFAIACGPNVVNVMVTYCDGQKTLYRIDLTI
jgi:uncharacterized lipoprotein YehR (DUF1307 family)